MERPALAVAIGWTSAVAAALALVGVLDLPIAAAALAILGTRAAAAVAASSPAALARVATAVVPLAALVTVAAARSGSGAFDAVRGANSVLGPAVMTRPIGLAIAHAAAGVAVLASMVPVTGTTWSRGARVLDRVGLLLLFAFLMTVLLGVPLEGGSHALRHVLGTAVIAGAVFVVARAATTRSLGVPAAAAGLAAVVLAAAR